MKTIKILLLFFSLFLVFSYLHIDAKELTSKELENLKSKYIAINPDLKKDIEDIFDNYPIYTNITFPIFRVNDSILDKMFTDLDYTGRVGRSYANSPYIITKEKDYFRARVRDIVNGTIQIVKENKENNRYIYMVKGYYDAFVTLRGKMLVDIRYEYLGNYINFNINTYIIIDNSLLWKLARYLKKSPNFQAKIDRLVAINVRKTIMLGRRTIIGIKKDLKSKKF